MTRPHDTANPRLAPSSGRHAVHGLRISARHSKAAIEVAGADLVPVLGVPATGDEYARRHHAEPNLLSRRAR
jgi:hypothetical protein